MKNNKLLLAFFFLMGLSSYAQEPLLDSVYVDAKYREDQFYAGVGYNLLANKPNNLSQSGFSTFIQVGIIRDFPINKRRNFGFGLGVGYAFNSFNQNMLIGEDDRGVNDYTILSETNINYSKNRFDTHQLEIPFELRWRTSTAKKYEFLRIYFGLKASYVFGSQSVFKGGTGTLKLKGISDFEKMQYGLTLSVGYNVWNLHLYYGLNPMFKDGTLTTNGEAIDMRVVRIGLIFYLL